MNYFKKMGISLGISLITYTIILILVSLLSYLNVIKGSCLTILKLLIPMLSLFIGSFTFGKGATKNGWLEGAKFGIIFIALLIIINLLFYRSFNISKIIYYTIILISSILGSMIGIITKKETKDQ